MSSNRNALSGPRRKTIGLASALVCVLGPAMAALGQCAGSWITTPYSSPGFNQRVTVLHSWDRDGAGPLSPVIVAGGDMTASGSTTLGFMAQWDPAAAAGAGAWTTIGGGTDAEVNCLATTPNGDLIAGGIFSNAGGPAGNSVPALRIGRFNGTQWSGMGGGMNSAVWSLAVRTVGATPELYASGWFTQAGSSNGRVAKWNGVSWAAVPTTGTGFNGWTWALAILPGNTLAVGGAFSTYNGVGAPLIAQWTGATWTTLAAGTTTGGEIYELFTMPNGDLIASGNFTRIGGTLARNVARFNGTSWSAMGAGFPLPARDFAVLPSGDLYAANVYDEAFTQPSLAKWDGGSWTRVATANSTIFALLPLANGDLLVGGGFTSVDGTPANSIAIYHPALASTAMITQQPADQAMCPGGSAVFVMTASGPGTLSYAWRKDGMAIDAVANPSAATAALVISPVSAANDGSYTCVVVSSCGGSSSSATSNPAMLSTCPANFNCSAGPVALSIQDIFDFLAAWFAQNPIADFNHSGGITVQDIFDFLGAWFAGC